VDGWLVSAGLPDGALVGATDGTTTGGEGVAAGVQAMSPTPRPAATTAVAMSLRTMRNLSMFGFRGTYRR
jgi:hypothetical protein